MDKKKFINILKKTWHFIWEDDSVWSWIVNIILAIVLIKFIIYPGLGLVLGTSYPIVAVVSDSMEHSGFIVVVKPGREVVGGGKLVINGTGHPVNQGDLPGRLDADVGVSRRSGHVGGGE